MPVGKKTLCEMQAKWDSIDGSKPVWMVLPPVKLNAICFYVQCTLVIRFFDDASLV